MNGYLLDTNVALLGQLAPERLSRPIRKAVETGPAFLSVISYWEVMIKSMKGSLDVGDPRQWWTDTIDALSLRPVLLRPEHIATLRTLGPHHADPFDRALIAQAIAEKLMVLTTDEAFVAYRENGLAVMGGERERDYSRRTSL